MKIRLVQCVCVPSLVFSAGWLLFGAPLGGDKLNLEKSSYAPSQKRDPFMIADVAVREDKQTPVSDGVFRLQGILYDSANPTAIVNDCLLTLKKPVSMRLGNVDVRVQAVEISREKVVLQFGEQRVELRLTPSRPTSKNNAQPDLP